MCPLKKKKETFYQNVLEEPFFIGLLVAKEKELIVRKKDEKRSCQERRHLELTCVQFLLLSPVTLNHLLHCSKLNKALELSDFHLNKNTLLQPLFLSLVLFVLNKAALLLSLVQCMIILMSASASFSHCSQVYGM